MMLSRGAHAHWLQDLDLFLLVYGIFSRLALDKLSLNSLPSREYFEH